MTDKTAAASSGDIARLLAEMKETPQEIADLLREFTESARILSSDHPRLIDEYPDKYVALARSGVVADADSHDELLAKLDRAGISRDGVIIRLIERVPRTLIL